ncbi:MAG: hypothetical protein L0956_08330, partial [Candidatus Mariimomonas ferrooxydans]
MKTRRLLLNQYNHSVTGEGVKSTCQDLISSAHLFLLLQSGYSRNIFFTRPILSTLPQPSLT